MAADSGRIACPCGGAAYAQCCEGFIRRMQVPPTALALMRSRYTAYTLRDDAYLLATWHRSTRPVVSAVTEEGLKWLGLEIRGHEQNEKRATVEFVARYKINGRAQRLHEISRFVHEQGHWFYIDGSFP